MANRLVLCAIASAALAAPASASVIALGSSAARMCYEAADSPMYPTPDSLRRCDDALEEGTLTAHEIGATYVNRGILHMRRGHVDRAIADFDAALRVDPNQPEAYLNKGAALLRMEATSRRRRSCSPSRFSVTPFAPPWPISDARSRTRRWAISAPPMTTTGPRASSIRAGGCRAPSCSGSGSSAAEGADRAGRSTPVRPEIDMMHFPPPRALATGHRTP